MSFADIKPYFRETLSGMAVGLTEWKDAFNIENIPSNVLNKSYHLTLQDVAGEPVQNSGQMFVTPLQLRFFIKGFRDTSGGYDDALNLAQQILLAIMSPASRAGTTLKNINFKSMSLEPKGLGNDNVILVTQIYSVRTALVYT